MMTKILGEQPFQVLSGSFSISPSNEGYTLQVSADGVNYSDLFAVGANITRMVTGVANGSFYRLSGNNSSVVVNWERECHQGGGGSYTLPVATSDTLGGVKIGSGISVDTDGVISVEGGGSAGVSAVIMYDDMPNADVVAIYNDITANTVDGQYKGDKVFYVLDEAGRVTLSSVRILQNFDGGDWIQMFALAFQDGGQYKINVHIKYNYSTQETSFEHSRDSL